MNLRSLKLKSLKILNNLPKETLNWCSFTFIYTYLTFGIILPFLRFNKLVNWDMIGLYFSAWYQKLYLFPKIIGWNPFFFLGYAQHQFYPPLYAYTTAALSYLMPLELAFKLIFVLILLLTPLSFYYLMRSFQINKNLSAALMVAMFGILFLFPTQSYGGNMSSTFNVGLITHTLGMMLFFFYFGALQRSIDSKKINFILPAVLFSLIILSHIVAAFAAAFVFLAYFICNLNAKNKIFSLLKQGILIFLLTAFWTIPFIAKREWLSSVPIGAENSYFLLGITILLLTALFFRKEEKTVPLALFIVLTLFFSFIATYFILIPIHLYRFMMYLYLLVPLILTIVLGNRYQKIFIWLLLLTGIIIILASAPVHPEGSPDINIEKFKVNISANERVLILPSIINSATPHILQHKIPIENNLHAIKGLYIESAKNGRYIFDIEQELNPKGSFTWASLIDYNKIPHNISKLEKILPYQLNLFNINWIVGREDLTDVNLTIFNFSVSPSLVNNLSLSNATYIIDKNNKFFINWSSIANLTNSSNISLSLKNSSLGSVYYAQVKLFEKEQYLAYHKDEKYYLFSSGNHSLIEVLNYTPKKIESDWTNETINWLLSENISRGILVKEDVPKTKGTGNESITINYISKRQDHIKFFVNSTKDVPILIKISAFPNWQAYQEGNKIKIYLASPYIMLVYGHGNIELKYENTFWDNFGNILSILGLIGLIFLILKRKTK